MRRWLTTESKIDELNSPKRGITEGERDDKEEEARIIRGNKLACQLSREGYDEHMKRHLPFPHCARGKRTNDPRRAQKEEEHEVPTMLWDYMQQRGTDYKVEDIEDGRNKTLIGIYRADVWISAIVVPKKGVDPYTVETVGKEINNSGFNRVLVKSDQEPSASALLAAVKNLAGGEVTLGKILEKFPVVCSRANRQVERYVETVQRQTRMLKTAIETRHHENMRNRTMF